MVKIHGYGLLFGLLLLITILIAGCSSDSPDTPTSTTVPTAIAGVKFVTGDIVAKTDSGGESQLYLITKYDAATDKYTRAWIYKNTDGSWGHFIDSRSEQASRMLVEKAYPVKVAHVTVSSIPVVTPTVAPATTITYIGSSPVVQSISPTSGVKDGSVTVTITGKNFLTGATPTLLQPGAAMVTGSATSVSSTSITTTFNLYSKDSGKYNVRVANPDGRSDTLQNAFTIGAASPVLSSIYPNTAELNETIESFTLSGQNFATESGVKVTFILGSVEIDCSSANALSSAKITCGPVKFSKSLNNAQTGVWDIKVLNIGQQSVTASQKFTLTNATRSAD